MRTQTILLLMSCIGLVGCNRIDNEFIFQPERFANVNQLSVREAIAFETRHNAAERTFANTFRIGRDYYPNELNFKLAHPKVFERVESDFTLETDYFFTGNDSLVKVILYQWNTKRSPQTTFETLYAAYDKPENKKQFQDKFNSLRQDLTRHLGDPSQTSVSRSESTLEQAVWMDKKISAKLELRDQNSIREIRLIIYDK